MAITDNATLQTALSNWLGRTSESARYPEWISLCEADIRRNLRKKVTVGALTIDTNPEALPATVDELRVLRFNTASLQYPLTEVTPAALADLRRTGSGRPHYYATLNGSVYLDITPDQAYTTEIVYFELLTPLSAGVNAVITDSPDIYLYGTLIHSAPYLEHDERLPLWQGLYQKALDDENNRRERAELGGSPMIINLPMVF